MWHGCKGKEEHDMPWRRDARANDISHAAFTGKKMAEAVKAGRRLVLGQANVQTRTLRLSVRTLLLSSCDQDGLAVNVGNTWSKQKWHIPNPPVGKET